MSFQRWMTLASPDGGTMAATRLRNRKRTSRQRLRRGYQLVAPGGKMLGVLEQAIQQQGHQQLPVQPGTTTVLPPLGQITQAQDRFHPLEMQLNFPAPPKPGQPPPCPQPPPRPGGPSQKIP